MTPREERLSGGQSSHTRTYPRGWLGLYSLERFVGVLSEMSDPDREGILSVKLRAAMFMMYYDGSVLLKRVCENLKPCKSPAVPIS
jgi:hypothetical protein